MGSYLPSPYLAISYLTGGCVHERMLPLSRHTALADLSSHGRAVPALHHCSYPHGWVSTGNTRLTFPILLSDGRILTSVRMAGSECVSAFPVPASTLLDLNWTLSLPLAGSYQYAPISPHRTMQPTRRILFP